MLLGKIPIKHVEHMFVCYNQGCFDIELLRRYEKEESFRTKVSEEYETMA